MPSPSSTADASTSPNASPAPAGDVVIRCVGLSKTFRDFWLRSRVAAVKGIDLEIHRGEVFGLLGPNGSGKSTTIKMLLGLLHPTGGHLAVFGHHPRDVAIKHKIGYVPEESYLYPFLNARETLDYYGRLFHLKRAKRKIRIDQLLQYVGLDKVASRPIGEYSKGMQRRIGLAQALINDPQLLILDEPTTGMDPLGTRQIKDLILDLKSRGKTILLCSHLLADVEDVTDRVAIMFGGAIRKAGPVRDLLLKRDQTTLFTPSLDPETIQEIEAVLTRHGKQLDRVDHPHQKLEALFLDIVQAAQQEGLSTSGATSGGRLAAFLSEQTPPSPAAVLDQLVSQTPTEPEAITPVASGPVTDEAILGSLITPASTPSQPAPSSASSEPSPELSSSDDQPDRAMLDDLLGDDSK